MQRVTEVWDAEPSKREITCRRAKRAFHCSKAPGMRVGESMYKFHVAPSGVFHAVMERCEVRVVSACWGDA